MYYRITDHVALRSWPDIGFAIYKREIRKPFPLRGGLASTMLLGDGEHDMETDDTVILLVMKGLIEPCEKGERPSSWSAFRAYDNACFPMMNLMITGKCNFNCLHCFNAADNAALMTEWSFEDICELLDQARDCGITSFQITGGEPMAHRRFLDILREIYKRDMDVFAINTNGWYLTQEVLDEMRAIGCAPAMKISFDGIGFHDWIRQRAGAQESAIASMELCVENGLEVVSNTQVNRKNVHTMMPTARLLNDIGVKGMRIIRTTEAPRWEENAANACLSLEEYYQSMLDFAVDYSRSGMMMEVETWQYIGLIPKQQSYYLKPVKFASSERMGEGYCCNCTHSMVAVTSDGEIMPCNQMSGYFLKNGISMGTVRRTPLRDLLGGGTYVRAANMTVHDLGNSACGTCRHFGYCGGGHRALGLLYSGRRELAGLTCKDVTKCRFFEDGWCNAAIVRSLKYLFNPFVKDDNYYYQIELPTAEFMGYVTKVGGTPNTVLTAAMFKMASRYFKEKKGTYLSGRIAADYRADLGASASYRDFVRFIHVRYEWHMKDDSIEELSMIGRRAIAEQNEPALGRERFFKVNKVHRGIDEQPTLKKKKRFALSNSAFRSDPRDPWTVSYVGKTDWGGMQQHIKDVYTISDGDLILEVNALDDHFNIAFQVFNKDERPLKLFFNVLDEEGIPYTVSERLTRYLPKIQLA